MATKVFIDGESGTTGLQIREKLAGRQESNSSACRAELRKDAGAEARIVGRRRPDDPLPARRGGQGGGAAHRRDGRQGAAGDRRLQRPPRRAGLGLRLPRADRGAGRTHPRRAEGHQSRLPRDGRDRAAAAADRSGSAAEGRIRSSIGSISGYSGGGKIDDRGLRERPGAGLRALRARPRTQAHAGDLRIFGSCAPADLPAFGRQFPAGHAGQRARSISIALPARPTGADLRARLRAPLRGRRVLRARSRTPPRRPASSRNR